ncbi:MAG: DNA-processing protein DprA [Candidatus Riflebacteria bacterium]
MSDHFREMEAAIRLSRLPGVGAASFATMLKKYPVPSEALNAYFEGKSRPSATRSLLKASTSAGIESTLEKLAASEIFGFYLGGPGYPQHLADLSEPPPVLFSTSATISQPLAAVVGARQADESCRSVVSSAVKILAGAGYSVLSGGAIGIDSMAHLASLELGNPTWAVFGSGIDVYYPETNAPMFDRIRENGGLLSELLCGAAPRQSFFPTRNRIIAAMSSVVVVVQAGPNSGSLITARWARRLKRRLLVMQPPSSLKTGWEGSISLIEAGAEAFADKLVL